MAADEKWYFTKDQIALAPSRKYGYDSDKELSCRQQAANFIQDMGQRLQVTQLCINTAIVYMHRFYMFHSFTRFHRNSMAAAALFLAAKVEEQPRKLEHVIKVSQICLHRDTPPPDVKSEAYMEQAQELVVNENILLQTLGFDVAIDHPHTHVVRCCQLVRAHKDLAQTSYFMASNSLHLTTMCLQYKPTVVACFCIHLACKWSNWEIRESTEGKPWFWYIDKSVTQELLEQLTEEFLAIFEKCPSRLKKKIVSLSQSQNPTILSQFSSNKDDKKRNGEGSSSSSGLFPTGTTMSTPEEMKKKQEFQRHHPEYKKHHLSTHHSRPDAPNVASKSSCMFGPPQRTQPSSHSSVSGSHPSRSIPKSSVPDMNNLGKPEHLHHRPRRPEEKHSSRNHEHSIPPPYKKFENKVPASGAANEFPQSGPNVNSRSGVNYSNNAPSGYQVAQQVQVPIHPAVSVPEPNLKESVPPVNAVPKLAPLPPKSVVGKSPPPVIKVERSIFSPEKSTPPTEILVKPLPPTPPPVTSFPNPANYLPKMAATIKQEEMIVLKMEPMTPIEMKQELSISPKEEKPPDLLSSMLLEEPVPVKVEPVPTEVAPSQSQPQLPPPEEHHSYKEAKKHKKEKKKHKEHKEHKEKHKDKHKHKHKNRDPEPIKITIPKDKLTLPAQPEGLKIKIARDKITTPIGDPVESPLKIKISQGKIKESKKRDRSEERSPCLPAKYHRPNGTTTLQVNVELDSLDCTNVKQGYDSGSEEFSKHLGEQTGRVTPDIDRKLGQEREVRETAVPVSDMQEVESFNQETSGTLTPLSVASGLSTPQGVQMYNNVEVHSPPSVQFDDSDLNFTDIPECSPPRTKSSRNDSGSENSFRGRIPLKSREPLPFERASVGRTFTPREQSNDCSNNNQHDWPGQYPHRSNLIYPNSSRAAYRGRGPRGGYRGAPRGYHEYPNRPWTPQRPPRPPMNYHQRGNYIPHAPRQRPQRMYYPPQPHQHMRPVSHHMSQSDPLLEQHIMLHEQQMAQYEQHMTHQQHMSHPPPIAHYAQQPMYVQYSNPLPPLSIPPLPEEPPPEIPPPPPPE